MCATLLFCRLRRALPGLLGVFLFAGSAWAQAAPDPIKYGQIDKADLTAAPFRGDSAAAAVVLCDFGSTSIVSDGQDRRQLRFDRITRIKILNKSGFDWARVEVLLRHESTNYTEQLSNLRGCTYNLVNGQVVAQPLTEAGIFVERVTDQYSLHKFALPTVREGSVIEFSYTVVSDYVLNFRGWEFQRRIPTRWSEYRASMPYQFNYKIFLQSKQALAIEEKTDAKGLTPRFRWAMRDVPALPLEPFMTTPADYVDELSFELANYFGQGITRTWDQIDQHLLQSAELGAQLTQSAFLKADLAKLPAATPHNAPQRLAAVRVLVCAAAKCTGEPGVYPKASLRTLYQQTHQGTVAEVNALLILALRAAGFAANPVLLSTRAHGRVRATLPQLTQFNYLAAHVKLPDGEELVLDATDPLLPYDMLPERCLNQQGRLVLPKAGTSRWIALTPRQRHVHLQQVQLQLAANGALSGQVREEFAGYAGAGSRTKLQEQGEKKYTLGLTSAHPLWTFPRLTIANRDSVQKPLAVDYAFTAPAEFEKPIDVIHFSPLQSFSSLQNPYQATNRAYPVDFGFAQEEIILMTLTLPAGYELAEIPKAAVVSLPNDTGRFRYSVGSTQPGVVQLISRLTLSNAVYPAEEYANLRELYRLLLQKQGEKLIIRKKSGS